MDRNWRFRKELNRIFEEKKSRNSRFSLRAFAASLEVAPSSLSSILNGSRPLSDKNCKKFGKKLNLSDSQIRDFMGIKIPEHKQLKYNEISEDHLSQISDWYHFAIMELIKTKNFNTSHRWIAKKLGINVYQVDEAVEKMVQLKFIKINDDGTWEDCLGPTNVTRSSKSKLKLLRDVVSQSYSSINKFDRELRAQSFLTVAVNKKKVDLVREKFIKFKKELGEILEDDQDREDVYHLSLGFFPAHKPEIAQ